MSTVNHPTYATGTITMDMSALASSSTFVAGVESNEVDNSSNLYHDFTILGSFIVGTTPTLPCQMNFYFWGSDVSLATTAIDVLDGTSSAETLTNTTVLNSALRVESFGILVNTSNIAYPIHPISLCTILRLKVAPKFWGVFAAHNMTAALKTDAGNTNSLRYLAHYFTNT